jgi:hypothetical protein
MSDALSRILKGLPNQKLSNASVAMFKGFWLGILPKHVLHQVDEYYYDNVDMYHDEGYHLSGLLAWEQAAVDAYFQNCHTLMLLGAGGGRETIALAKQGFQVDGFECHPQLAKFAHQLLSQHHQGDSKICTLDRDACPPGDQLYDGIIVGWGAYMLVQGKPQRIHFLQQLRQKMPAKAPLLISFYHHPKTDRYFGLVHFVGSTIRKLLGRPSLDRGDDLAPEYVHYFNQAEIVEELKAGGFDLAFYGDRPYGHAVAIALE